MKAWLAGAAALALTGCVSVDYSEEAGYAPFAEEGRDALRGAEALEHALRVPGPLAAWVPLGVLRPGSLRPPGLPSHGDRILPGALQPRGLALPRHRR